MNERDNLNWLPIHEACNYGHLELVELLIRYGAKVNDLIGPITPLHDVIIARSCMNRVGLTLFWLGFTKWASSSCEGFTQSRRSSVCLYQRGILVFLLK